MKTKLLPMMVGAILAGGMTAAAADVTLFGRVDVSIDSTDIDAGAGVDADDINMNSNTSSVGVKGSEDLGNGLAAIFQADFGFDADQRNRVRDDTNTTSESGAITDRDQWIGLKGGFGTVVFGTKSTVYKSHGAKLDPLYKTSLQGRARGLQSQYFHSGAGEELNGRHENTIRWDSPNWNGVQVGAFYALDNDESDGEDEDPYGIGGSYSNGGILVFGDWQDNGQGAADPDGEITVWKLGGKYSMNNFAVMGQYEDATFDDGVETEATLWHVGGSYTMGNNLLYLGYGQGNVDEVGVDEDYNAITIAGIHSLSKRTKVYAGWSNADCDMGSGTFSDGPCDDVVSTGGDNTLISVGMNHKF